MARVHLDTDLGGDIDDLCALALVLKWPGVEVIGITTSAEESGRRAGYVKYALQLAGRPDIEVVAGAEASLRGYRFQPGYPPQERYWLRSIEPSPDPLEDALSLLRRSIEQDALIVAIGLCTNLSLLETRHPGILSEARLFLMGGHIKPIGEGFPQWGPEMDYNFQIDITSAQQVLTASHPTLIPIEVTLQTALRRAHLPALRASGPLAQLIALQASEFAKDEQYEERYGQSCRGLPADIINFLHDPLACAVALGWEGVTIQELPLVWEMKDGWLVERVSPGGRPIRVVSAIERDRFNALWCSMVTGQSIA